MIVIGGSRNGTSSPRASASSTSARAVRSLTLPPGLRCSHFTKTLRGRPAATLRSSSNGVLPIASMTFMARVYGACMAKKKAATDEILVEIRDHGLALPGAHLKSPWPGHKDLAVDDKTFAYLNVDGEPLYVGCKLPRSSA